MRLLDRYVIRNFVQVYFYCIAGFTSIWLIFDVSDNISSFIDNHIPLLMVVRYYATQIPQVFIILLPVALLLSLLFALGRMSRANEIVSMLTAGVSLPRILVPLIGIGLLTVAGSMALNYSLAPHAELARKTFLSEAQSRPARTIQGQVFRNRTDLRTWFIQNFRLGDNTFTTCKCCNKTRKTTSSWVIRLLKRIIGLRQRHGIWRTCGSLTTIRLGTLPRKSFVPR